MSKMRVVTVDSDKLRAEVASMRAESTLYHDWDGLNNNACMPAFKEVKERLDKLDPNESAQVLKMILLQLCFKFWNSGLIDQKSQTTMESMLRIKLWSMPVVARKQKENSFRSVL